LGPVLLVLSYLLWSVPAAYIAGRLVKGIDIRQAGDGNVGAANAYREISPLAGWLVLIADTAKGTLAVLATRIITTQGWALWAGLAVLLGHIMPIYIGFRGGRGEATAAGVLLAVFPLPMLGLAAVATIPFLITRNTMILGAILFAPLFLINWLTHSPPILVVYSIAIPATVGLAHLVTTRQLTPALKRIGRLMR